MIEYNPRGYVCQRTESPIVVDGVMDEQAWVSAKWTEEFVDIEGALKPLPYLKTRARMLWDSTYFYISAFMVDPDLWGTLTERDAVIYHDNDFEVFIDPNGDSHEYYELEVNALGTEWDLLLVRPYRDGAPAVNAWDIQGLKTAVSLDGSINDPTDRDAGWAIEIAIPWTVLSQCAHRQTPPGDGDTWWINFSRVHWELDVVDGSYVKRVDSATGRNLPEYNWVWSPQGLIAMHYPEMWGLVQFSTDSAGTEPAEFTPPDDLQIRNALWQLYYAQREHEMAHGSFCSDYEDLVLPPIEVDGFSWPPSLHASRRAFIAESVSADSTQSLTINQEGRMRSFTRKPEGK